MEIFDPADKQQRAPLHSSVLPWHHGLQGTGRGLLSMLPAPDLELIKQPELILQNYTLQDKISIPVAPEATGQK